MKYALSSAAIPQIRDLVRNRAMLAFDIDGTLAPIAADPSGARIPDDLKEALRALSAHTTVAIITGRAIGDARQLIGFDPHYLVGNHGAEGNPGFDAAGSNLSMICTAWRAQLDGTVDHAQALAGVMLEDKRYSLTFHYRRAARPVVARKILEERASRLFPPPDIVLGKRVINLLPPGAPHKGEALADLLGHSGCERALYVGDDVTDEDVFQMRMPDVLSIRVGRKVRSAADMYLKNQSEVTRLVRKLVTIAGAPKNPGASGQPRTATPSETTPS